MSNKVPLHHSTNQRHLTHSLFKWMVIKHSALHDASNATLHFFYTMTTDCNIITNTVNKLNVCVLSQVFYLFIYFLKIFACVYSRVADETTNKKTYLPNPTLIKDISLKKSFIAGFLKKTQYWFCWLILPGRGALKPETAEGKSQVSVGRIWHIRKVTAGGANATHQLTWVTCLQYTVAQGIFF